MKYIPYQKMSKKQRRSLDLRQRGSWGGISPVTRKGPDRRKYDRGKLRAMREPG